MSVDIRLDIHPNRLSTDQADVTGVRLDYDLFKRYDVYEYHSQVEQESFGLFELSYNGVQMPGILPHTIEVRTLTTYFAPEDVILLLVCVDSGEGWIYYVNPYTKAEIGTMTFMEFTLDIPLTHDDILKVLGNVTKYKGLDIKKLHAQDTKVVEKLVGPSDVFLDFSQKLLHTGSLYSSIITGTSITMERDGEVDERYIRVRHSAEGPFRVRGIKLANKSQMRATSGFPNEPITSASIYYKEGDKDYRKPLLVELNVDAPKSGLYILAKHKKHKWDVYKLSKSSIKPKDLGKVLKTIEKTGRLDPSQLESHFVKLPSVKGGVKKVTKMFKAVTIGITSGVLMKKLRK